MQTKGTVEGEWMYVDGAWYFSVAAILPRSRLGRRTCLSTLHNSRHKNAESEEAVGDHTMCAKHQAAAGTAAGCTSRKKGPLQPSHPCVGGGVQRK